MKRKTWSIEIAQWHVDAAVAAYTPKGAVDCYCPLAQALQEQVCPYLTVGVFGIYYGDCTKGGELVAKLADKDREILRLHPSKWRSFFKPRTVEIVEP